MPLAIDFPPDSAEWTFFVCAAVILLGPLLVERIGRSPMLLRKSVTKIPEALQPAPKQTIRVQAYDDEGRLVHDLDVDPPEQGPGFHMVTGVREHGGRIWLGSLHEPSVAVLDRP